MTAEDVAPNLIIKKKKGKERKKGGKKEGKEGRRETGREGGGREVKQTASSGHFLKQSESSLHKATIT